MDEKTLKELHTILQEKSVALNKATMNPDMEIIIDKKYLNDVNKAHKEYIDALNAFNKALTECTKNSPHEL